MFKKQVFVLRYYALPLFVFHPICFCFFCVFFFQFFVIAIAIVMLFTALLKLDKQSER